jgi:hypothetical protein
VIPCNAVAGVMSVKNGSELPFGEEQTRRGAGLGCRSTGNPTPAALGSHPPTEGIFPGGNALKQAILYGTRDFRIEDTSLDWPDSDYLETKGLPATE